MQSEVILEARRRRIRALTSLAAKSAGRIDRTIVFRSSRVAFRRRTATARAPKALKLVA